MWIVCITSVRHVLTVNGYGGRQTKENEKSWCFKGWETLVINICTAIRDLKNKYPNVDFVYPMHLNPNVRKPIYQIFGDDLSNLDNMFFIEPLEYLTFVYLMEKSLLVLTDSGGIQEEAPGLGKPVLVMRDTTERPEALSAGTVKLVGTNYDVIVGEVSNLIDNVEAYNKMSKAVNPYGDGLACGRIADYLISN